MDISDWAMENARKILEPPVNIKEKIEKIFSKKPMPIFISTPKKGGIDWGDFSIDRFTSQIDKTCKNIADNFEERLFRYALEFRSREVWVIEKTDYLDSTIRKNYYFYPKQMDIVGCEQTCYNFDKIIFMKRSEFRKLPRLRNFSLVLKYRKTMRKMLGVK